LLSYQHAFHAGNHADVLKHISLIALLGKFNQKAKPYFALDTHAGTGYYDLDNQPTKADALAFTQLLNAYHRGDIEHTSAKAYLCYVNSLHSKAMYPGSPMLLSQFARAQDNLHANELSAPMFKALEDAFNDTRFATNKEADKSAHVQLHQRDAFELTKAITPPSPNRGFILIDPPYEQASEYEQVAGAVEGALKKWRNGTFMIWYPLLSASRINRKTKIVEANPKAKQSAKMLRNLAQSASQHCTGGMLSIEFANQAPSEKVGMYGSGVCIINPPYKIDEDLNSLLVLLQRYVQQDGNQLSSLTWHERPA
jgi:23S rRNA (adenine2030-N6)-methyltransferase